MNRTTISQDTPSSPVPQPERLRVPSPFPGDVILTVDPRRTSGPMAAGLYAVPAGAVLATHRHLGRDLVLFVHKGQGRMTIAARAVPLLPGVMIHVPPNTWASLRNTGTGLLQLAWWSSPTGLEELLRELAKLGDLPDAEAVRQLLQRFGVEVQEPGAVAGAPAAEDAVGHRRRRRHRSRRRRGPAEAQPTGLPSSPQPESQADAIARDASAAPATPSSEIAPAAAPGPVPESGAPESGAPGRRRRRRHRGRGHGASRAHPRGGIPIESESGGRSAAAPQASATESAQPAAAPEAGRSVSVEPSPQQQRPGAAKPHKPAGRHDRRRRENRRRVKEVYMGGRWVTVSGDGPIVADPRDAERRRRSGNLDDETSAGPLSVSL